MTETEKTPSGLSLGEGEFYIGDKYVDHLVLLEESEGWKAVRWSDIRNSQTCVLTNCGKAADLRKDFQLRLFLEMGEEAVQVKGESGYLL